MTSSEGASAGGSLWQAIAGRGRTVRLAAGTPMLHHGDEGRHCYAVLAGEVVVSTTTSQGALVMLGRRGPGAVIGELAALDAAPRSATAIAGTDVTAVILTAAELEALLLEEPELALRELRRLSRQLRTLTERYTLRNEELRTRLVTLLLTHVAESGQSTVRATRQELADWVGVTREAATRTLRRLEEQGLVSLGRSTVTVVDAAALSGLVGAAGGRDTR